MKTTFFSLMTALAFLPAAWTQTPYVTDANTLFLYHFDETSGSTANDSSGNERHATYGTSVILNQPSLPGLTNAIKTTYTENSPQGRVTWKDIANPNGEDSFLYNLTSGDFTVEAWIRLDETFDPGNRTIIAIQPDGTNTRDFSFGIHRRSLENGGTYHLAVGDTTGPNRAWSIGKPITLELGTWYHVAVTGTKLNDTQWSYKFYYNQAGDSSTPDPLYTNTNTYLAPDESTNLRSLGIGSYGAWGLGYFPGAIDEVRISNIARTQFDTLAVIPEPSSLLLIGLALGLTSFRNRHA